MWLLLAACAPAPVAPPNVLLVTLDTTRRDAIGVYSGSDATPNIDRIANEGYRFDRAYTVTPLTIPAHSSIHTGMYPPRHGVQDNGDFYLGEGATTIAERLSSSGYRTMASVGAEVTSHHWGFQQGFSAYFDDMGPRDPEGNRWRVERPGNVVVDEALGWLEANKEQPWFAWVHMFDAHNPYAPPPPWDAIYADRPYTGEVAFLDSQVQRLRDWMEKSGELENTWIFIVADHGEGLGSHGESLHGVLLYDATTHIPFLIRPPDGRSGAVSAPVSLVDLAPTIVGVTGAPPLEGIDGLDLRPFMAGQVPEDRAVYAESLYAWHHYAWAPQNALVTRTHKLIDSTTPELYAADDERERLNLATTMPSLLSELTTRLHTLATSLLPASFAVRADSSGDRVSQLEALGYMTTDAASGTPSEGLPDPVRKLPVLRQLEAARSAFQSGDLAAAEAALAAAQKGDPNLLETRTLAAQIKLRRRDVEGALADLRAIDAEHPSSRSKAMIASTLLAQGNTAEAVELFSAAIALDPYQPNMWAGYLHALLLSQDPRLLAEAARGDQLLPHTPAIVGMKGVALAMNKRVAQAQPLLEESLAADPSQPFVNHALGIVWKEKGDTLRAEPFFEEEVRLFPPAVPSRRQLVEIYAGQKRYDEQLAQLREVAAHEAPAVDTQHSLAQVLFNLKKYPEAMATVQTCRTMAPEYPPCALLEANTLVKLGRREEGEAAFEKAKALVGK